MTLYRVGFYIDFDIEVEEENENSAVEKAIDLLEDTLPPVGVYPWDVVVHEVVE